MLERQGKGGIPIFGKGTGEVGEKRKVHGFLSYIKYFIPLIL